MVELNIPYPIIFGTQRPQLRMMLEDGKQYLYSINNYNLYINPSSLDEKGNLTIKTLLMFERTYLWSHTTPAFAESQNLVLPICDYGQEICPMLFASYDEMPLKQPDGDELQLKRVHLHPEPQLHKCKVFSPLLNCLTTAAEKKFAEVYYTWAICGSHWDVDKRHDVCNNLSQKYGELVQSWQKRQLKSTDWQGTANALTSEICFSLKAPALIPQVWLNYTYDPSRSPNQEMDYIRDIPKRVDFLFIKENRIYVVEIDDPSHYATYNDSKKRYEVDEQRYTVNLRAERIFRNQGLEIRRFSNWEILNSSESELVELIRDALGIIL